MRTKNILAFTLMNIVLLSSTSGYAQYGLGDLFVREGYFPRSTRCNTPIFSFVGYNTKKQCEAHYGRGKCKTGVVYRINPNELSFQIILCRNV